MKFFSIVAPFIFLVLCQTSIARAEDIAKTHYAAQRGNPDARLAYVYLQGGPVTDIAHFALDDDGLGHFSGDDAFYVIPHQVQTRWPERFDTDDITFDQAVSQTEITTRIAGEVIEHLKSEGKKVHVVGMSYGAFVAASVLATYGKTADSYVIVAGRVDAPEDFWSSFAQGEPMKFVNGTDLAEASFDEAGMSFGQPSHTGNRNMARLAAGLAHHSYSELLSDTNLYGVTYVTAQHDEKVGRLTEDEVAFLKSRGASVHMVNTSHSDALFTQPVYNALKKVSKQ